MCTFLRNNAITIIKVALFALVAAVVVGVRWYFSSGKCIDVCSYELIKGVLRPLISGGQELMIILGLMLLAPRHIYKKWLLWIGAPGVILIVLYIPNVSVYNSGIISWSPAGTAKALMQMLGVVTVLFVLGHIIFDRHSKEKVRT
jgi:hypothetical protein